jgi:hypothetical protein
VVILDVGLEVLGQAVDPLREQRNLNFGRTSITRLDGVRLDNLFVCRRDLSRRSS